MELNEERLTWVAYCAECGGWYAASVDDPRFKKDTAKEVARWIKEGARVEKITCQAFRDQAESMCECRKKNKKSTQAELAL